MRLEQGNGQVCTPKLCDLEQPLLVHPICLPPIHPSLCPSIRPCPSMLGPSVRPTTPPSIPPSTHPSVHPSIPPSTPGCRAQNHPHLPAHPKPSILPQTPPHPTVCCAGDSPVSPKIHHPHAPSLSPSPSHLRSSALTPTRTTTAAMKMLTPWLHQQSMSWRRGWSGSTSSPWSWRKVGPIPVLCSRAHLAPWDGS